MAEFIIKESGYPGRLEHETMGELVRCRDCKYFQTDQCYIHIERIWELTPDDYCSLAERREE